LESGRPIVAYQTFLIVDIIRKTPGDVNGAGGDPQPNDPPVVKELYGELREVNLKNYLEAYHDAEQQREDLLELFNLGYVDLTTRARGEVVYWKILDTVLKFAVEDENDSEEVEDLKKKLAKKYIANFSLFQSTPDIWGVKQLFPIMPVHRLNEEPKDFGNLVDITCDSDGEIRRFIAVQEVKEFLELHAMNGDPYYVGIFLLGAYQDTLGDFHNLLGTANEVHIVADEKGWKVDRLVKGDTVATVLGYLKYDPNELMNRLRAQVAQAVEKKNMPEEVARGLTDRFERTLEAYTYLKPQ
jgi:arginine decarboxylase